MLTTAPYPSVPFPRRGQGKSLLHSRFLPPPGEGCPKDRKGGCFKYLLLQLVHSFKNLMDSTSKCNTAGGIDGELAYTVFAPTNHPPTERERNQIYAFLQEDVSHSRIAMILRKDTSTISREGIAFVMKRLTTGHEKRLHSSRLMIYFIN